MVFGFSNCWFVNVKIRKKKFLYICTHILSLMQIKGILVDRYKDILKPNERNYKTIKSMCVNCFCLAVLQVYQNGRLQVQVSIQLQECVQDINFFLLLFIVCIFFAGFIRLIKRCPKIMVLQSLKKTLLRFDQIFSFVLPIN